MPERQINKPWGCEIIWAETDSFVGKFIYIKAGHRLSLQYHDEKKESFMVDRGKVKFHWVAKGEEVPTIVVMAPGDHFDIPPGMIHRVEAIDDCCLIEISTPQIDDVHHVKDDYGV